MIQVSPMILSVDQKNFTMMTDHCAGCGCQIMDKYLMRMGEKVWHESCLKCSLCSCQLSDKCYCNNGSLLCAEDYAKLNCTLCQNCNKAIESNDLVMKAGGLVYHVDCFTCATCNVLLQKGDHFMFKEGHLYCVADYEKEYIISPKDTSSVKSEGGDDSSIEDDTDDNRNSKRPRTVLTISQRRKFKASFELNPKPSRKVREALAADTGLTVRVVQVWFQNQRAKIKKMKSRRQGDMKSGPKGTRTWYDKDDSIKMDECDNLDVSGSPFGTGPPNGYHPMRGNPVGEYHVPMMTGPPPPQPPPSAPGSMDDPTGQNLLMGLYSNPMPHDLLNMTPMQPPLLDQPFFSSA